MKAHIGGILERILQRMDHATKREQALALELAQVKDEKGAAKDLADERLALLEAATTLADDRLAMLTAAAALADERLSLLTAAASRADGAEQKFELARRERELTAKRSVRLELRVQALSRRRERLQAELGKVQDQLARADSSGSIRQLQEEKAQLQQRLADLQTYFTLKVEPGK